MIVSGARQRIWTRTVVACGIAAIGVAVGTVHGTQSATASPLPVTPYNGNSPSLTRAPYVTDLTQSSAYVNWATTSSVPGSLQIAPVGAGGCPAATATWSATSHPLAVPTQIPYLAVPSTATTASWAFSVVNGAGTSVKEYQASVPVSGLTPGTAYCYAVFSTNKVGAVDLLPASSAPALGGLAVQSFTTLVAAGPTSSATTTFDVIDDTGENYLDTILGGAPTNMPFGATGPLVNPDEASLYQQIGQSGAQFLIDAGDTAYNNGSQTNFGDLEQTGTTTDVSNFFGPWYYPLTGGIPLFDASGDHNQNNTTLKVFPTPVTTASSGGTYAYVPATGVGGFTGQAPADWYAVNTGNIRVYVLDAAWGEATSSGKLGTTTGSLCGTVGSSAATNCEPYEADYLEHWQTISAEYQWLAADLANPANAGMVKLAVLHFPLRSDSSSQPSDLYTQNSPANPNAQTSLEALLAANGVQVTFSGHAHVYQRTTPSAPGQVVNYVTGGGGAVLAPVSGATTKLCKSLMAQGSVYAIGWSPTKATGSYCGQGTASANTPTSIDQVFNFIKVSVSGSQITVSPTNAQGQVFDQQTYTDTAITPTP
jgi:hypothetical protein